MTGSAVIKDRRTGSTFVAEWAESGPHAVTFRGRLRVRDLSGERQYPARLRTLPLSEVAIEWLPDRPSDAYVPSVAPQAVPA